MILIVLAFKFFFTPFQGMYLMLDVLSQNHTLVLGFTPLGVVHTFEFTSSRCQNTLYQTLFSY